MAEQSTYSGSGAYATSGLNLMSNPLQHKPGDLSFARDFVTDFRYGNVPFYSLARANRLYAALDAGYTPLGNCALKNNARCIFSLNSQGVSEIGVLQNGVYTPRIRDHRFNFRADKPIQAYSKVDIKGDEHLYWVDDYNDIRHVNLTNPAELDGQLNMEATSVFRKYQVPHLQITDIVAGGVLKAGSYYVAAQYADANGNGISGVFTPVGPVPIFKDNLNQPFEHVSGDESDTPTGKAIKVSLSKVDTSYEYLNIIIVRSLDGVRRAAVAATVPTTQTEYIYTGATGSEQEIDLKELMVPPVVYKSAKTLADVNGTLVIGNLKRRQDYNLQPFINNLHVQWQVYWSKATDPKKSYKNPLYTVYKKGYRRGEAYALGLVFIYKDGSKSPVYIIPGRAKNAFSGGNDAPVLDQFGNSVQRGSWDSQLVQPSDDYTPDGGATPERWRLYNTAFQVGSDLDPVTKEGPGEYGELGYQESTDRYPNNPRVWGELAGQPITLHKMPDSTVCHIHDGENDSRDLDGSMSIKILGLRFPNLDAVLQSLPEVVREDIQGWEIVRSDRRYSKSVVASGIIHNCWTKNWKRNQNENDDIRLYPNYPYNDLRPEFYMEPNVDKKDATYTPDSFGLRLNEQRLRHHGYRRDIFNFYSPDTAYEKAFLAASEMVVGAELYGKTRTWFSYLRPFPELAASKVAGGSGEGKPSDDNDKYVIQQSSYGYYTNYLKARHGQHIRSLKDAFYVGFNAQSSGGSLGFKIQNMLRESSVYVGLHKELANPQTEDRSRAALNPCEAFRNTTESFGRQIEEVNGFESRPRIRPISAYYATLRNQIPNQYGSVTDIAWLPTGFNHHNTKQGQVFFGGDTFISLHTFKKQHTVFRNLKENALVGNRPEIDLRYTEVVYGMYYFYEFNGDKIYLRVMTPDNEDDGGYVPTLFAGIPCFWCESDINTDLRLAGKTEKEAYFPDLADGSIQHEAFTGVLNADVDNAYLHNPAYSENNDLASFRHQSPFYDPDKATEEHLYNRVIWSMKQLNDSYLDYWLVFKPNNYYDFPTNRGELWDIRHTGAYRTLYRFQHSVYAEATYAKIEANEQEIQLGSGKLFERDPVEIATTDNGYAGTRSQWAFNSTEFGHFMADVANGKVFQFNQTMQDITMNNVAGWFQEHLPLKLLRDIPNYPYTDCPASPNGVGLTSAWDPDHKLWYLTKVDYELINPLDAGRITYRDGQILYDGIPASLKDDTLFANRSFTIGYSPLTQKWVSFYSFIPGMSFPLGGKLITLPADNTKISFYEHNVANRFCEFYGERSTPVIEFVHKPEGMGSTYVCWNNFTTRAYRYSGAVPVEDRLVTFSSAVFYNNAQSTGKVKLVQLNEDDLSQVAASWFNLEDKQEATLSKINEQWSVNDLYDASLPGAALFTDEWAYTKGEFPIDKVVNPLAYDRLRSNGQVMQLRDEWLKARYYFEYDDATLNLLVQVAQVVHQEAIR